MLIFENSTYLISDQKTEDSMITVINNTNQVIYNSDPNIKTWRINNNSDLAQKIIHAYSWVPVLNESESLVDVDLIEAPIGQSQSIQPPTIEEQITEMQLAICELYESLVGGTK